METRLQVTRSFWSTDSYIEVKGYELDLQMYKLAGSGTPTYIK